MSTFTVTVTREDNLWVAVATDPDGTTLGALDFTDFGDVRETMPEFVADMAGVDSGTPTIAWRYEINGKDVTAQIERLLAVEDQLHRVQREQERARKEALAALTDAGLSQRIMANVMHLSHQRIHQLVHG
ncbi:MAG: hypothetical protein ACRDT2_06715 [Natronosporangium sp.]